MLSENQFHGYAGYASLYQTHVGPTSASGKGSPGGRSWCVGIKPLRPCVPCPLCVSVRQFVQVLHQCGIASQRSVFLAIDLDRSGLSGGVTACQVCGFVRRV